MAAPQRKARLTMPAPVAADLLRWYDQHGRNLPWRVKFGRQDPYLAWLAEIMLQQTTVITVIPYYEKFIARWPNVTTLAQADIEDVLAAWAGLGYYRRAHNLHRCARIVAHDFNGRFPATEAELKELPGIGDYTAAAIAAIAFGRRANVVDGNVERVMARLHAVEKPLPQSKRLLRELAEETLPQLRCGDYAQALMDLGATVCTPKRPRCSVCPWHKSCLAVNQGDAEHYPLATQKTQKPKRYTTAFWLENGQNQVWLRRRPATGLLAGMMEVPTTEWQENAGQTDAMPSGLPRRVAWHTLPKVLRHSFTHFDLYVRLMYAIGHNRSENGDWYDKDSLKTLALPSLMRKIAAAIALWRDG